MKSIKRYSIILILGLIILGCTRENYLNNFQPPGISVPSTIADYRLLLDQVDGDGLGSNTDGFDEKHTITAYVNDNFFLAQDLQNIINISNDITRAFRFDDLLYTNKDTDPNWDNYYRQIYLANIILDGLNTVTDGSASEIDALRAEAKLHRAYAYFNLVNIYALQYNSATADTDLGVPIREGILLENVDLTRASIAEVYNYMIDDIAESINDLPDVQPALLSFRPSKVAAYGLLSKIYLFQGNYNLAVVEADNALTIRNELRNLSLDSESAVNPGVTILPDLLNNPELLWYKEFSGTYFVTQDFFESYFPIDLRATWFTPIQNVFGVAIPGQYLASAEGPGQVADGINTAELYLIRAECNARLGNLVVANGDINTLRENRFVFVTAPLNITDQEVLIDIIKDERRKELVYGANRFFDIKRYNAFDGDNISLTHTFGGETFELPANSPKWALPIAPRYIELNPEIVQNPRN